MGRWKYRGDRDHDRQARVEKIRKSKRQVKAQDFLLPFELDMDRWNEVNEPDVFRARVVEVHKRYAFVSPEPEPGKINTRDVWLATVTKRHLTTARQERNFICVGDLVLCRPADEREVSVSTDLPRCVILHMAPRRSELARRDPMSPERRHVLASNIDQQVIVASYVKPTVKWGLIDRYLVLAETQELPATIVLTKKDLLETDADEEFRRDCEEKVSYYRQMGYDVFSVQANLTDDEVDPAVPEIEALIRDKISLLSGHSGVGKSSLVNQFEPEIVQEVEPNEDIFYKGRHTTTYASFIKLGTGGYMIDTPGIRSFCIDEHGPIDLSYAFRDMRPMIGACRYRECRHLEEPECAVKAAVEQGQLPEWRYRSYLGILLGATGREGRLRDIPI